MTAPIETETKLEEHIVDAIMILEQTPNLPSPQVITLVDHAERKVVQVRDALIAHLRQEPTGANAARRRGALKHVNVGLSVLASLEYPAALLREHIDEAIQELGQAFSGDQVAAPSEREKVTTTRVTENMRGIGLNDPLDGVKGVEGTLGAPPDRGPAGP